MMRRWVEIGVWAGIAALAMGLVGPMLAQSYPMTHSTHFNLSWAFQYQRQFLAGQFYPRWLEFSNFGFGNANFAFYPPLCMVATLPFRILGWDLPGSLIGSMALAMAVAGLGFYRCARCYFPIWIAIGVAGLGMVAPYFWVDIYQRGAIGEVWAIVALPWILWAGQRVVDLPKRIWPVAALAIGYGGLVLSHLPTLLIFTLVWALFPWLVASRAERIKALRRCYGSTLLAFGWTGFFLWPATVDQRFVQVGSVNANPDYRPQNNLIVSQIWRLQPQFLADWFGKGLVDLWWLMVLALLLAGLLWLLWGKRSGSRLDRAASFWLAATAVAVLMMTDLLGWIYPFVITLQRIQFSWRWMAVPAATVPLLLGYAVHTAAGLLQQGRRILAVGLACLCFGLMARHAIQATNVLAKAAYDPATVGQFATLADAKRFPDEPQQRPGRSFLYWHWVYPDGLSLVDVPEYRAHGVTYPMPPNPDTPRPLLSWFDGSNTGLQVVQWRYGLRQFSADNRSSEPQVVLLRTFYYPAWRSQLDGNWILTQRTAEGQLALTIPPGQHQVSVAYLGTAMDWLGTAASLVTVIGGGIWWRRAARPSTG